MTDNKYSKLSLVLPDKDILTASKRESILVQIVDIVRKYLSKFSSAEDIRLIRFVTTLIENLVKPKHNIDKLGLCIDIFKILFPDISMDTINKIISIVEDLLKNNQIKKIPVLKYVVHIAFEFIKDTATTFFFEKRLKPKGFAEDNREK